MDECEWRQDVEQEFDSGMTAMFLRVLVFVSGIMYGLLQ